jgi:2-amino-4-hydroxy-6-hydroxymethyldihydropteridine diphosphokinase
VNTVVIGIGSNILPEENIGKAVDEIKKKYSLIATSTFVITKPIGGDNQPDFINGAVLIKTKSEKKELSKELKLIEAKIGRIRGENKYAPREIDLDIVIYNGRVEDDDIYSREFLKNSVEELLPDFKLP